MTTPEKFDFDVFLAHNSKDKEEVKKIRAKLMRKGSCPWMDKYDLQPFGYTQDQVDNIISQIRVAAVFIGDSGIGPWEDEEVKVILSKKSIVRKGLVILPGCPDKLIEEASSFIKERHWVDFRELDPDPIKQLIWAIDGAKDNYFLQELIDILTPIDFNTIVVRAYRYALPEVSYPKIPKKLEALVLRIAEIPGEEDNSKPLWQFVNFLINHRSVDLECQNALTAWAEVQKIPLDSTSLTIQNESEVGETSLMIKVVSRPLGGYIVSVKIATDPDPLNTKVEIIPTKIDIPISPDPKYFPGYSQEQLPLILEELIAICGDELSIPLNDLVVQWFLPLELMSLAVEYWQIHIGKKNLCHGERCKVVILRSSNRQFPSEYRSVLGEWKKYWHRLINNLQSPSHQALSLLDPSTGQWEIDWNQASVVGGKFIDHDDCQQQEDFWDELLGQGLPIALWSRQPVISEQRTREAIERVTNCSLADLPNSLTRHRQTSLTSDTTSQPEIPLSLLWDNPFRPFSTIPYESQ